MFSTKIRTTIITLVAAFSVVGVAAVPAYAQRTICQPPAGFGGPIICHQARGCAVVYQEPDGSVLTVTYEDGVVEEIGGTNYKCNDGNWEIAAEGGGRPGPGHPPGERLSGEPLKNAQGSGSTSSRGSTTAPLPVLAP